MDLDLACVSSFLILVDERHFGRASARLHLSPSALSKRLQRLEHQLGTGLVERGPSGMLALTPAGSRFAREAGPLLTHAAAVRHAATEASAPFRVRLGFPGVIGEHITRSELAELGALMRHLVAGVALNCRGVPFHSLTDAVLVGAVDVILTASPVQHSGIDSSPLVTVDRSGIVPARHDWANASVQVEEFVQEPMVYDSSLPAGWMAQWYLGDVRPAQEARLVDIRADDSSAVLASVAGGAGFAAFPSPFAGHLDPRLAAVQLVGVPPITFFAGSRHGDHREPVTALIHALRTFFTRAAGQPQSLRLPAAAG
ncbi:LysR family transcriptional regulator [Arthrobacter sunyaminii]|uniref:LysR family transcriptional regulator n=1 Tax=Arthrobacter sunyaminii TaxID=2816859 RepID=A0A975XLM2_9MICC|nr:LysR family transcriptional regulator [Arthrobacter sunyaminii]MBO0907967.1 LysR family transcriptional regulator [Arthrobacter sunyaminii]QWQ37013.1 LysR family transcriptional regulator [Arthrobacter sunyaminii]